jgi:hypothetical protein
MVQNHIWVMEKSLDLAVTQSEKEGKPITDQIFFFNMAGLGLRHLHGDVMDSVKECFTIDEKYYPELVQVALVINAPRIFTLLFKLVSPFVDPDTLAKTKILGTDWMDEALKYVEPENLPAEWGGKGPKWTRTAGGFVLAGEGQQQQQVEVQVAARSQTTVPFKVEGDNYQLTYEFSSVDYDVEFGIVMLGEGDKQTVVEKVKRYNSHVEPVHSIVTKLKAGNYQLVFNNAYSWTTDKQIKLSYYVYAPPAKMSKSQKKREKAKRKKEAAKAAK